MGLHAKYTGIWGITHHSVAVGTGVWSKGEERSKALDSWILQGDASRGSLVLEEKR